MPDEMPAVADEPILEDAFLEGGDTGTGSVPEPPPEPVSEPTSEPASEPAPEPAPAEPVSEGNIEALLAEASAMGLETEGIASEADLSRATLDAIRQMQPAVNYARWHQSRQPQPQPEPKEPESEPEGWNEQKHWESVYGGPRWQESFSKVRDQGLVERDPDTGAWRAVAGAEQIVGNVLPEMNAAQQHQTEFWRNIMEGNPFEVIGNALKPVVEQMMQDRMEGFVTQRETQQRQQDAITSFQDENAGWLFRQDLQTGQQVFTDEGQKLSDSMAHYQQYGMPAEEALTAALAVTGLQAKIPEPNKPAPQRSDDGSAKEAQQKSFLENAKRAAQHSPSTSGGRSAEDAPVIVSETELDGVWENAAREAHRK